MIVQYLYNAQPANLIIQNIVNIHLQKFMYQPQNYLTKTFLMVVKNVKHIAIVILTTQQVYIFIKHLIGRVMQLLVMIVLVLVTA